jgi:hypothetical protein
MVLAITCSGSMLQQNQKNSNFEGKNTQTYICTNENNRKKIIWAINK